MSHGVPITQEDYFQTMMQMAAIIPIVRHMPLEKMREAQARADAVGWFLDPTSAMRNSVKFEQDVELTEAFRSLQRAIEKLDAIVASERARRGIA